MRALTLLPALLLVGLIGSFTFAAVDDEVQVTRVPSKLRRSLKLDGFYRKYVDAGGVPVLSSKAVSDEALLAARELILAMLPKDERVLKRLQRNKVRLAVIGKDEVTTDIPEHADLNDEYDRTGEGTNWNTRARGLGATRARPACSVGEENLLGLKGDRYRGESILIHEFAHTIHTMGIAQVERGFERELEAAYRAALEAGKWADTYAATDTLEYLAEGVQSWFDANLERESADGVHNQVNTRAELLEYDPTLAALIARWFRTDEWRYTYPRREPR